MTIERILKRKGDYVPTAHPDALIKDVIASLESDDVGAVVVSTDDIHIDGIISERDVVRGLQSYGPSVLEHPVKDMMTKEVVVCTAEDRVAGVMAMMDEYNFRHVPVVKDNRLIGIVSIKDIIKLRLREVQADAEAMQAYISGAA